MLNNPEFKEKIRTALNQHSVDNEMGIPDYILANYIVSHLLTLKCMRVDEIAHAVDSTNAELQKEALAKTKDDTH